MSGKEWRFLATAALAGVAGLAAFLVAAVHAPAPGSLDDVFVPLYEARGWLGASGLWADSTDGGHGAPEVEASTSALDVIAKAASLCVARGADPLRVAGWLGIGWVFGFLVLFAAHAARRTGSGLGSVLLTVGAATSLALVESASYRLEGPLFALTWLGLLLASGYGRLAMATVLAGLVVLARPEGLALAPPLLVLAAGPGRRALGAVLGGVVVASVTVLRFTIYGSPLPNTYYAKSSDDRVQEIADGAIYLADALATPAGIALVLVFAACTFVSNGDSDVPSPARGWLWASAGAAAVLIVSGGDGYPGARLALPLAAPVWLAATVSLRFGVVRWAVALALALQLGATLPAHRTSVPRLVDGTWQALVAGPSGSETFAGEPAILRRVAAALDGETFAHRHAQRYRWFQPWDPVLDLTGLTDREIARTPAPGPVRFGRDALATAVDRRVGAIYLDTGTSGREPLVHAELESALTDPIVSERFFGPHVIGRDLARSIDSLYVPATASNPAGGGAFNILVRRDLAERFRAQGFDVR